MKSKVILTAAVTGGINLPCQSPYLPITPEQIISDVVSAYEAGASIAHVHVRNPENGKPSSDIGLFREVTTEIKNKCDIIVELTTGGAHGMSMEERIAVIPEFKPEMASLNAGSFNFAIFPMASRIKEFKYDWEKPHVEATDDFIFPNTFKSMIYYLNTMNANGTKPEMEIYDVGMINNVAYLMKEGYVKAPVHLQFVMGLLGGLPATIHNLIYLVDTCKKLLGKEGEDFTWSAFAAGKDQMTICTQAVLMGGHARLGLEDSLFLGKGELAKSSGEQVAKMVRIMKELGLAPATPAEVRQEFGLKGVDQVKF